MNESILAMPTRVLTEFCDFVGAYWSPERVVYELFHSKNGCPRLFDREQIEQDETLLQLIPYFLVYRSDAGLLLYNRGKLGGEPRLDDKWSFGIGGHVNSLDLPEGTLMSEACSSLEDYHKGAFREVLEEIGLPCPYQDSAYKVRALLRLTKRPVDRVHLGFVHFLELTEAQAIRILAKPREEQGEILKDHVHVWVHWSELARLVETGEIVLESWSQVLFDCLVDENRRPPNLPV